MDSNSTEKTHSLDSFEWIAAVPGASNKRAVDTVGGQHFFSFLFSNRYMLEKTVLGFRYANLRQTLNNGKILIDEDILQRLIDIYTNVVSREFTKRIDGDLQNFNLALKTTTEKG